MVKASNQDQEVPSVDLRYRINYRKQNLPESLETAEAMP